MTTYNLAEFFAGTGAFSLAFENTNKVKTIYANDLCKNSEKIYNENFNNKLILKDIHDLKIEEIPKMNILTAGFPCQPFSIAGEQKGFKDERSNTFWKLIKIIN
jgi:DNA (cytosine-5)-methyltransferase 1